MLVLLLRRIASKTSFRELVLKVLRGITVMLSKLWLSKKNKAQTQT